MKVSDGSWVHELVSRTLQRGGPAWFIGPRPPQGGRDAGCRERRDRAPADGDICWRTIGEAERYTRAAERKRIASGAMHLLGTKGVEMFPTLEGQGSQVGKKAAKR